MAHLSKNLPEFVQAVEIIRKFSDDLTRNEEMLKQLEIFVNLEKNHYEKLSSSFQKSLSFQLDRMFAFLAFFEAFYRDINFK